MGTASVETVMLKTTVRGDNFVVSVDQFERRIEAKLLGVWTIGTVREFELALRHEIRALQRQDMRAVNMLFDGRNHALQVPEVVMATQASAKTLSVNFARVAIVLSSALLKMQIQRISPRPDQDRYFADIDEARRWLAENAVPRHENAAGPGPL